MKKFDLTISPLDGANLIEASAGTGKTATIAGLYLRLILEKNFMIDQILTVTFTVAAVEELNYRIRKLLKNAYLHVSGEIENQYDYDFLEPLLKGYIGDPVTTQKLKVALTEFDKSSITTIHGFCQSMLLENAFESNELFDTELLTDQTALIQEIVDDFWRINFYDASEIFIEYVLKKKFGPELFLKIANNISIDPHCKIIPKINKPDINTEEKKFIKAYKEIKNIWLSGGREIKKLLTDHQGLKKNIYSKKNVEKWISELNQYFHNNNPISLFKRFDKFTSSAIADALKKDHQSPDHLFFQKCHQFMKKHKSFESTLEKLITYLKIELLSFVRLELKTRSKKINIRSYDDLLINLYNALNNNKKSTLANTIRNKYKAALIDEFQDTDPVQYNIFMTIFNHSETILYLIGDPKQAIYRFRSADVFAYIRASKKIKNRFTLNVNRRSSAGLINAVNTIFSHVKNPFIFKEIQYQDVQPADNGNKNSLLVDNKAVIPLCIHFIDNMHSDDKNNNSIPKTTAENLAAESAAVEISRLLDKGKNKTATIDGNPVMPGHIAVLVRKKYQAESVQQELKKYMVQSVIYGSSSIFASKEAIEIKRVITAVANPNNESMIKASLVTSIFGYNGNELLNIIDDNLKWESILEKFHFYNKLWHNYNFITMFNRMLQKENVRARILTCNNGERIITNILHCIELLHQVETDKMPGQNRLIKWLAEKIITHSPEESQLRLESDENAVKIITIHRSKGLEFPIVFCPFTWEGSIIDQKNFNKQGRPYILKFHDRESDDKLIIDVGSGDDNNKIYAENEELAENLRLFYVALTRAKYRCYITYGKFNNCETSAPSYLFHRKDNLHKEKIVSSLNEIVKNISNKEFFHDVCKIKKNSGGTIDISKIDIKGGIEYKTNNIKKDIKINKKLTTKINSGWSISSYSSLIHYNKEDYTHTDYDSVKSSYKTNSTGDDIKSIFTFPAGSNAGNFIHNLIENIDFTRSENYNYLSPITNNKLQEFGFDSIWLDVICKMITDLMTINLNSIEPVLKLKSISGKDRLNELEFYFPVEKINSLILSDIFLKWGETEHIKKFSKNLSQLQIKTIQGFIRGFIDLLFFSGDKYYIIDWKSNFLGNSIEHYSTDNLTNEMMNNFYILQYHIYTVAVHKYLSLKLKNYDYEKNFGGVMYIFIRGIDKKYSPDYGIYRDIPAKKLILKLSDVLTGE